MSRESMVQEVYYDGEICKMWYQIYPDGIKYAPLFKISLTFLSNEL